MKLKLEIVDKKSYKQKTITSIGGYSLPKRFKVKEGEFMVEQKGKYRKKLLGN